MVSFRSIAATILAFSFGPVSTAVVPAALSVATPPASKVTVSAEKSDVSVAEVGGLHKRAVYPRIRYCLDIKF